jgi:Fe-S-cluster-containing dehydrogenase component
MRYINMYDSISCLNCLACMSACSMETGCMERDAGVNLSGSQRIPPCPIFDRGEEKREVS